MLLHISYYTRLSLKGPTSYFVGGFFYFIYFEKIVGGVNYLIMQHFIIFFPNPYIKLAFKIQVCLYISNFSKYGLWMLYMLIASDLRPFFKFQNGDSMDDLISWIRDEVWKCIVQ